MASKGYRPYKTGKHSRSAMDRRKEVYAQIRKENEQAVEIGGFDKLKDLMG